MAFKRKRGGNDGFQRYDTSSLAVTVGDLLAFDRTNEVAIKATATSSMEDIVGVAVETIASAATSVLVQRIGADDEYEVATTNNSAANNYQRMILTDEATVNNTGTDSTSDAAVVMQISTVGAAADKKILVRLVTKQDRA